MTGCCSLGCVSRHSRKRRRSAVGNLLQAPDYPIENKAESRTGNMKDQKISPISVLDQSPMFVCGVMHRTFRNRAQAELSRQNLMTLEMASALTALEEFQPMSQQELADAVLTERSVAKRMVDNLEKRGFVQVSKSETNQRLKILTLTKEGVEAVRKVHRIMTNLKQDFFSCLTEEESDEFFRLVRKMTLANHA